jgi:hypothetical protein
MNYIYQITFTNKSYYISNSTINRFSKLIKNNSTFYKELSYGNIPNGRILNFECTINGSDICQIITDFKNKYEYLDIKNILIKKKQTKIETRIIPPTGMGMDELMKDVFRHNKQYPDYGSNEDSLNY